MSGSKLESSGMTPINSKLETAVLIPNNDDRHERMSSFKPANHIRYN